MHICVDACGRITEAPNLAGWVLGGPMWCRLGGCNGLGGRLFLGDLGRFLFDLDGFIEDSLGLGYDAREHIGLLRERLGGCEHHRAEVVALCDEDGLLGSGFQAGAAQTQALIQHDGLVEIALGIALVNHVPFEELREEALRTDAAVRFCAVEDDDRKVVAESLTFTGICQHYSEQGKDDVLDLGALDTFDGHKFLCRLKLAIDAYLALIQEHGCIGGNRVVAVDAESDVELRVVGVGVILCHNDFDLRPFSPLMFAHSHRLPCK